MDLNDETEAWHTADMEDSREDYEDENGEFDKDIFVKARDRSVSRDYDHYIKNKAAKTGTTITCAENRCKKVFVKKSYQQAFCCTKHKNQFWNRQRL
jgi:hypothetical protein